MLSRWRREVKDRRPGILSAHTPNFISAARRGCNGAGDFVSWIHTSSLVISTVLRMQLIFFLLNFCGFLLVNVSECRESCVCGVEAD